MTDERAEAGTTVASLAVGGLLAIVIGTAWAFVAWPDGNGDGSRLLAVFGLALTGAGCFALMAAIVAWSVRLGIAWSGLRDQVVHDVLHPATPSERSHLDDDGL